MSGSHCPICEADIGTWAVVRASLPNRIFCPHCRARVGYEHSRVVWTLSLLAALGCLSGAASLAILPGFASLYSGLAVFLLASVLPGLTVEIATAGYLRRHKRLRLLAPPCSPPAVPRLAMGLDELLLVVLLFAMLGGIQLGMARTVGRSGRGLVKLFPDGRLVASSLAGGSGVFDTSTADLRYPLPEDVRVLEFSPDGRWLGCATGKTGRPGGLLVFHATTGELVLDVEFEDRVAWSIAFSSSGDLVAANPGGGRMRIWRLPRGNPVRWIEMKRTMGGKMAFLPGGRLLVVENRATGSRGHDLLIFDTATGERVSTWNSPEMAVPDRLTVSRDGTRVAIDFSPREGQRGIRVRDTASGEEVALVLGLHPCHDISRDGRQLLARNGEDLVVWDLQDEEASTVVPTDSRPLAARFVEDDRRVLVATDRDRVVLWDLETASTVSKRGGFPFHHLGFSTWQVVGFLLWVALWFLAYRLRRRHPDRPTGRPELGVYVLPVLAAGFLVTISLWSLHMSSVVIERIRSMEILLDGASGGLAAVTCLGIGLLAHWPGSRFRGRLVLMVPCFAIVAWLWLSILPDLT